MDGRKKASSPPGKRMKAETRACLSNVRRVIFEPNSVVGLIGATRYSRDKSPPLPRLRALHEGAVRLLIQETPLSRGPSKLGTRTALASYRRHLPTSTGPPEWQCVSLYSRNPCTRDSHVHVCSITKATRL